MLNSLLSLALSFSQIPVINMTFFGIEQYNKFTEELYLNLPQYDRELIEGYSMVYWVQFGKRYCGYNNKSTDQLSKLMSEDGKAVTKNLAYKYICKD